MDKDEKLQRIRHATDTAIRTRYDLQAADDYLNQRREDGGILDMYGTGILSALRKKNHEKKEDPEILSKVRDDLRIFCRELESLNPWLDPSMDLEEFKQMADYLFVGDPENWVDNTMLETSGKMVRKAQEEVEDLQDQLNVYENRAEMES